MPALPTGYLKYLEYIRNTGGTPPVTWFDVDWAPIGPTVREHLAGYIEERDGKLYLTDAGQAELAPDPNQEKLAL